jgi:glycosyltransferase involved in cell wall biosynthesis
LGSCAGKRKGTGTDSHWSPEEQELKRRLLCLSTYPREDASFRQRILQYLPYLAEQGWVVRTHSIACSRVYRHKNDGGWVRLLMFFVFIRGVIGRLRVILLAGQYDAVWVHREAFPFFTPHLEKVLSHLVRGSVVMDLDDALYAEAKTDWRTPLRNPACYPAAVRTAAAVTVGSPNLQRFALDCGVPAHVIPTCVDTATLRPRTAERPGSRLVLGWIGSWSTAHSLEIVGGVLAEVQARIPFDFLVVGPKNYRTYLPASLEPEFREWSEEGETDILQRLDIGLMPLEDTEWNGGKCSYKIVQYMSVAVPFIASPVGMNVDVTKASGAGLLARTSTEWHDSLLRLLTDRDLRSELGARGRAYASANFDYRIYTRIIDRLLRETASKAEGIDCR